MLGKFLLKFKLSEFWAVPPRAETHPSRMKTETEAIAHVIQPKNDDPNPNRFA